MTQIFRDNNHDIHNDLQFYNENYHNLVNFRLNSGSRIRPLQDEGPQQCRFCGKKVGEINAVGEKTSFRLAAHAIPEALGNRALLTKYECDFCNANFGKSIENDFGKWIKPLRTFSLIRGKKKIPSLTQGTNGSWKILSHNGGLVTKFERGKEPFEIDKENKTITFNIDVEPYRPEYITKTFYKIFLSLIPKNVLGNFLNILGWVGYSQNSIDFAKSSILHEFTPGPMPSGTLDIDILIKKYNANVPPAILIIRMKNDGFQVCIPDDNTKRFSLNMPAYPINRDVNFEKYGRQIIEMRDLSDEQYVRKDKFVRSFRFESGTEIDRSNYHLLCPSIFDKAENK